MKKAYFTSFVTILLLTFVSVAYAAFSSDLKITGEASVLKDTVPPTCGSWYLRESSLTTQEAYDQNKFINAGTNTTWTNTNKTLFIECSDNLDGDYGCINVDTVTTSTGGERYFKDVKNYTTSIKTDGNVVTVTLKDAYQNERTCTLPVGGSNPYIDKEAPTVTITRSAANKFTYTATDNNQSLVKYMVTTSNTRPSINDSGWSSTASEVTIDQTGAKTYYVWAKDGVNINSSTISTYLLTKTQGTGTTLSIKYGTSSGAELSTGYVLAGTQVYVSAEASTGYGTVVVKKDTTAISNPSTQTINSATTISSSASNNTYTIAYNLNNGSNPNPKPTTGTYNSDVVIGTTSIPSKTVTITGDANSTGATVGSATINTQVFAGWTSSSSDGLGSGAKTGTSSNPSTSWTGSLTTNKYFKNLRDSSGTVTLTANWSGTANLPSVTKTGNTCKWYDASGASGGNLIGDSGGTYTVPTSASTAITIYARCTPNVYNITLNKQGGTGGTGTIYEKYSDGYYLTNTSGTVSDKMSTSANPVTIPTKSGYTFGGYYTSTGGAGTQYINASGYLTSNASTSQFTAASNLYAKWTLNNPATPTISGGETRIYGSTSTVLTCNSSTVYPTGIDKYYSFGYSTTEDGTVGNWTTANKTNTLAISANEAVSQKWYACKVYADDGSSVSSTITSSNKTEMTINNAKLTFEPQNGDDATELYTRTGQTKVFTAIRNSVEDSIPIPTRTGYEFMGWYDAPSAGNKVLNDDGTFTGTAVSGYTSTNAWATITDKTLYAYWNGISYNITLYYNGTQSQEFGYISSNTYQEFTFPYTGTYQLEAWGAQGGSSVNDGVTTSKNLYGDFLRDYNGGLGSYTKGNASFNQGEKIYIYVGQQPLSNSGGKTDNFGGFNGGGTGRWDRKDNDAGGGGGGATDFRYFGSDTPVLATVPITSTTAISSNAQISLRYRIMVAAGGGGRGWSIYIGHGGGLSNVAITGNTRISTQTYGDGAEFGRGGTGGSGQTLVGTGGGGGGYWGGGSGNGPTDSGARPGNGGSSYVSGYTGCIAVEDKTTNNARIGTNGASCTDSYSSQDNIYYQTNDNLCSVHFTGKTFTDIDIISGDATVEEAKEDPKSFVDFYHYRDVDGNYGDGHARISLSSIPKGVTSGQPIGSLPLPYGDTYIQKFVDDDNYEDSTSTDAAWWTDLFADKNYEVEYEIKWYDKEENPIDENTIYDPSMGDEFYAHGVPKEYDITYDLDGGSWPASGNPNPLTYNGTQSFEPTAPIDHKIENGTYYEFVRWETTHYSQSGLQYTSSGIEKGDRGDKTFTAIWEAKSAFTVTYDANGGTTTCTNSSGMYGDTWTLCSTPPTRGDTEFLGWYTAPSGGTQITTGGTYGEGPRDGSYILYAHWDIKAIEYDYNIEQLFTENSMMDTYYKPDWSKTFEFEITIRPSWANKRYLLIGNYDTTSDNSLNIELTSSDQVKVYVGTGYINENFGTVPLSASSTIKVHWDGTTQILIVDISGAGSGHYEKNIPSLTGISSKNLRIGSMDYRHQKDTFSRNNIQGFVIREYYTPPLQENITAPDPAGHYLLFDGWTGANGTTPEYEVSVPLNSTSLVHYDANWSPGVSRKLYSKTFSTSNKYIKFKNEVVVQYIDQARRIAYTRERVNFFRTNSGYNTYGHGSMTVRYNWNAALQDFTVSTDGKKINERGINMWSEYWDDSGNSFRSIPYQNGGTRSVTLSVTNFTHAIFYVDTPKRATFNLPPIKPLD